MLYEVITNAIRRRANKKNMNTPSNIDLQPNLSNQEFLDEVLKERRWELCAEPEGRWFDIVRLHILEEVNASRHPEDVPSEMMSPDFPYTNYFAKIPLSEFYLNLNLKN